LGKSKGFALRKVLTVLCIVLSLFLLALIAGAVYLNGMLNQINRPEAENTLSPGELTQLTVPDDTVPPDYTGVTLDPEDVTLDIVAPEDAADSAPEILNILLIGQDRRPGQGRQRSDAMILCTVNKAKKTVTMTSFLRDLYVEIPGFWPDRLNAAYQYGGMKTLDETLAANFGIRVDANVEVDFSGFQKIIDLAGGVEINLTVAEAGYLNENNGWNLKNGVNRLSGSQALAYVRIRKLDSDFGRTNRQRRLLSALMEQAKELSIPKAMKVLEQMLPLLTTDLSNGQILQYGAQLLPLLSDCEIRSQQIPVAGTYRDAVIQRKMVLIPDLEKNRAFLRKTLKEK